MDFSNKNLSFPGKRVGTDVYYHVLVIDAINENNQNCVTTAIKISQAIPGEHFNVVKISQATDSISLLNYPRFFEDAFPALADFWTVDLINENARYRTYADSLNPPILHRKELLIPQDHPQQECFRSLTLAVEQIGLFDNSTRIGFKRAWETLLSQRGYQISGHKLIPIANDESTIHDLSNSKSEKIARHLTALTRYGFSAPIQALARFGFLDGSKSVFDYGCGRGDDLRGLRENTIEACGWDPHYAPDEKKHQAHIVNLGFVINVIENIDERIDALRGAFALADELLIVSAMLANQDAVSGTHYGDGVLTSRNTFQKYFTQGELRQFISETLCEEPIPVGPGIFFIFKDKDVEQRFMYGRLENRRNILRLSQLSRPDKPIRIDRAEAKYEAHHDLFESLWEICLKLGRDPDRTEIPNFTEFSTVLGSITAAIRFIKSRKENAEAILEESRHSRINDLRIYFAQLQFEKRKPYKTLEARLQKDIRVFFGDYNSASEIGRELLFTIANVDAIGHACHFAAEHGIGWLEDSKSLQLHTSLVEQLPPILRTYVQCGTHLYGDVSSADIIKIHIRSGKLTLMTFDDFIGKALPKLLKRVKLNLRKQDLDIFDYSGHFEPPYLYRKSRFINEEFLNYAEQIAFEDALDAASLMDFKGYGPSPADFDQLLELRRWQLKGFSLVRSKSIPELDSPCGRFLTYRNLIECGETQARTGISNLPKEPDSYTALLELTRNILDPVIDYFGMINLTYGFCSPELARQIHKRIAPELDQHAAHEKKCNGNFVCDRLGAACDFFIQDENMEEVIAWVRQNTAFDRIYYIKPDRPIHVSYSLTPKRQVTKLIPGPSGKLIPRVIKFEDD